MCYFLEHGHTHVQNITSIKRTPIFIVLWPKPFILPGLTWWSCYQNKGECDLNQSNVDSFVERVAKNSSGNNGDHDRISIIFLINCFALGFTLAWKTVHSSQVAQIAANLLNPIRPGLFSRSSGPRGGGGGAQRPGCQKSRLTSTDWNETLYESLYS